MWLPRYHPTLKRADPRSGGFRQYDLPPRAIIGHTSPYRCDYRYLLRARSVPARPVGRPGRGSPAPSGPGPAAAARAPGAPAGTPPRPGSTLAGGTAGRAPGERYPHPAGSTPRSRIPGAVVDDPPAATSATNHCASLMAWRTSPAQRSAGGTVSQPHQLFTRQGRRARRRCRCDGAGQGRPGTGPALVANLEFLMFLLRPQGTRRVRRAPTMVRCS